MLPHNNQINAPNCEQMKTVKNENLSDVHKYMLSAKIGEEIWNLKRRYLAFSDSGHDFSKSKQQIGVEKISLDEFKMLVQ